MQAHSSHHSVISTFSQRFRLVCSLLTAADMPATPRPRLRPAEMFNMSFGFLGIQFGWGLQLANMSAVYERLGASPDRVPLLWLAAPLTGLLVQPVIGAVS